MFKRLREFRVSSILDVLFPPPEFWFPDEDRGGPGILDRKPPLTSRQVRDAAEVLIRLDDRPDRDWSYWEVVNEAEKIEADRNP